MTIHDDQPFKNWGQTQHVQVTGGQCGIDLEGKCAGKPDQFGCQNENVLIVTKTSALNFSIPLLHPPAIPPYS